MSLARRTFLLDLAAALAVAGCGSGALDALGQGDSGSSSGSGDGGDDDGGFDASRDGGARDERPCEDRKTTHRTEALPRSGAYQLTSTNERAGGSFSYAPAPSGKR